MPAAQKNSAMYFYRKELDLWKGLKCNQLSDTCIQQPIARCPVDVLAIFTVNTAYKSKALSGSLLHISITLTATPMFVYKCYCNTIITCVRNLAFLSK